MRWLIVPAAGAVAAVLAGEPQRADAQASASILDAIGIDQRLGQTLPVDARFRDETGRDIALGDVVSDVPVVLALVYYGCPMLCSEALDGLVRTVRAVPFDAGVEYRIVTVSFDPRDGPELAAVKKRRYLDIYGRGRADTGWRFLTGTPEAIAALTEAVGFRYVHDEITGQFAHASGVVVVTPDGKISRYFYGIDYPARDLELALIEASSGAIGNVVDQLVLYCYRYDPSTGRYGLVITNALRLGGSATVLVLAAFVVLALRRERRRKAARV